MKPPFARRAFATFLLFCSCVASVEAATPCIWFADDHALYQVNTDTNQLAQTVAINEVQSLAMNGGDCGVIALVKKQLVRFDPNGVLTQTTDLRSLNNRLDDADQVIVDPYDNSLWLRDKKTLFHLNANGQPLDSWMTPGSIRALVLALDQSVWVLGNKQLWHYSAQGALLASQELKRMGDSEPKLFAIDSVGGWLWLAGEKHLVQINLNQANQTTQAAVNIPLPKEASALALNPLTGELWLATSDRLLSYGRDGKLINTIDLQGNGLHEIRQLAFDPVTQTLWALSDQAISRFTSQGQFLISLSAQEDGAALAVPAFTLTPTLALVQPSSNGLINNALPTITYGFDALCNNQSCAFTPSYFSSYTLAATLNQKSISPFVLDATSGQRSYTPTSRLPEGLNTLSAHVTDSFGHASPIANDQFTVDTIPPKFLSVTPVDGSVLTTPQVTLQGTLDDVTATVVLNGIGQITNTSAVGATLNFSYPVTLAPGLNTFVFTAIDKAGNSNSVTLHVTYLPVSVTVTSPANGATVDGDSVLVTGTFQGPSNTGITVNGVAAAQVGNKFYAQVPLQPGANVLTLTATTVTGATVTQTINVISSGASPIQVHTDAASGIAPLTVNFTIQNNTANAITKIEADFNGDGITDFTTSDPAAPLQFIYTLPGMYQAHIKITDNLGKVVDKTVTIVVQDPAVLDQMLKAQWNGMNSALIAGDKAKAMSYLNAQAKDKYGPVFDKLMPQMPAIIASASPIKSVTVFQDMGEYAVNRTIDGVNTLFFIYFLQDDDGVWHLDSM